MASRRSSLILGAQGLPAAVFIYKNDESVAAAWDSVQEIATREGAIRGELHHSKASFLQALKAWNLSVDSVDSFLCIYCHAGERGIAPLNTPDRRDIIQWDELADALPHGVRYLWLLGCETDHSHNAWAERSEPIAHHCLSTVASAYWQPFIEFFAREISVEEILSQDELMARLKAEEPLLASKTQYSSNVKWQPR
jgi:hypothetical protein